MRINRNINQYFDRMGPDDVRLLWSVMLDLKTRIRSVEYLYRGEITDMSPEKSVQAKDIAIFNLYSDIRVIDRFMAALKLEKLFDMDGKWPLGDNDVMSIIEKYHWLMDEIEE